MHSENFELIKEYFDAGLWSKAKVKFAVARGKIMIEEYYEIVGEKY